jgi:mRNA-degrading endonuclease toxin of MazEF toxin-antitoxin module
MSAALCRHARVYARGNARAVVVAVETNRALLVPIIRRVGQAFVVMRGDVECDDGATVGVGLAGCWSIRASAAFFCAPFAARPVGSLSDDLMSEVERALRRSVDAAAFEARCMREPLLTWP